MASALTPQQVVPVPPRPQPGGDQLELGEMQGDVLLGLHLAVRALRLTQALSPDERH